MSEILRLDPEIADKLHPLAVRWLDELSAGIDRQLEIDGLTPDDMGSLLSQDEEANLQRLRDNIQTTLLALLRQYAAYPYSLADGSASPAFLMMQLATFPIVEDARSLLRKAHERKLAASPDAVRKQLESERRSRALAALDPPMAQARKYLTDPAEYLRFGVSIDGAVDAYLELGKLYRCHDRAKEYRQCLDIIEDRRGEEARKQRAQAAADAYNRRLNEEISRLSSRLQHKERDLSIYLRTTVRDKRCSGHDFEYILSEEQKGKLDLVLTSVANQRLEQLCSEELRQFIVLPCRYYRRYYPLPSASYSFQQVPCLDVSFDIFAALCVEVWLKPGKKSFNGFEFALPSVEGQNGPCLLKSPTFLGYHYSIVRPEELNTNVFWKRIPLIILAALLSGEIRPKGTMVSAASDKEITYRMSGVEIEVTIPNTFADYLRAIGTIDRMIGMSIMSKKVGDIVKSELTELAQKCEVTSREGKTSRQDTKKARAWKLFGEGKRPSDHEVKALGLKPDSAYRYYQDWKKARNQSQFSRMNGNRS